MDRKSLNLPVYSIVLSVVTWLFAIFAELLPQTTGTIVVYLAYLSCFASIILAVIAIRRKTGQNIRLAKIAVVLDALFVLAMLYLFIRLVSSPKIVPP